MFSSPCMVSFTPQPYFVSLLHLFLVIYRILKQAEESNDPEQRASAHFMSLGHKILMSFGSSLTQEDNQ